LLSLYCLMQAIDKKSSRWTFLVGTVTAVSFLVSPDIGLFILIINIVSILWFLVSSKNISGSLLNIAYGVVGMVFVVTLFIIWSTLEGWLGAYTAVTKDLLFTFSGVNLPNGMGFPNILQATPGTLNIFSWAKFILSKEALLYWGILFYITAFLYTVVMFLRGKATWHIKNIAILIVFGFFLYTILIGRWGIGHFFFILSPILIVGGYFSHQLLSMQKKTSYNRLTAGILIVVLAVFAVRLLLLNRPQIIANFFALPSILTEKNQIAKVGPVRISAQQEQYFTDVSDFINENVDRQQPIFFISNEPVFYLLADVTNQTRYDLPYIAITKAKRYEILASLRKEPPLYIFYNTKDWYVDGISNRQRMPEVASFIDDNYTVYKNNHGIVIYKYKYS
jgi:hypothetical protein